MKLKIGFVIGAALIALPAAAEAGCLYNGITYGVGAKICRNGWLEECTPANYWKAVGQCLKDDKAAGGSYTPVSGQADLIIKTDKAPLNAADKRAVAQ